MTTRPRPSYVVPDGVGWVEDVDEWGRPVVYCGPLPHGPASVLRQSSAIIWLCAIASEGPTSESVAAMTGLPSADITHDVEMLLDQLVESGLLRRSQE